MSVINTNVKSLVAQNAMSVNSRSQDTAMQQLSTGMRINASSDDAAGLAIASRMTSQIRGLDQAVRNANDGISMLQTADSALATVSNMLQRQHELSVQHANGTYNTDDQASLLDEFDALSAEIDRIQDGTQFAGNDLFTATAVSFQVGTVASGTASTDNQITASLAAPVASTAALDIEESDTISDALTAVNESRSAIGATVNRLTFAADNAASVSQNMSASRSRIQDTDYAKASSELARTQIIAQASTAMLAQANQSSQGVLALLK
ncbi:flagellin [Limnohabitans sp. Rim8]|uniref:flagellin N-terminal helical domain-containing protein n=1 Tax=Limnohabitans sp. Rim8 TaxID=1100718 RepID=UPI003305956A